MISKRKKPKVFSTLEKGSLRVKKKGGGGKKKSLSLSGRGHGD